MIGELATYALILAFCLAIVQCILPLIGAHRGINNLMHIARATAIGQFLFILFSFCCLIYLFLSFDFSIEYVAINSSKALPWYYRVSATWASHEGSFLLWILILSLWAMAVAVFSRRLPLEFSARVLAVMGFISAGFLMYLISLSNPFKPLMNEATGQFLMVADGQGMNPFLQDFGMIIHPPLLYMGYVGFCVAFSFAIAALMGGRLDSSWARWSRPWTTLAWVFLTLGISLGSWWAYYELGWGGWWFWDPVENASLMPWLVGTALIHSYAVTDKRSSFQTWTVMLAIIAFSMSLLGTFLVRSGVLKSVHAFSADPARGIYILIFFFVIVGGSLLLYARNAIRIKGVGKFSLYSKESFLLVNNILLLVMTVAVLIGTLYPVALDAIRAMYPSSNLLQWALDGPPAVISVGKPYFNFMMMVFLLPLVILMPLGAIVKWKQDSLKGTKSAITSIAIITSVVFIFLCAIFLLTVEATIKIHSFFIIILIAWIMAGSLWPIIYRMIKKGSVVLGLKSTNRSTYGMSIAHFGIAIFVIGAYFTTYYSSEKIVKIKPGETLTVGQYKFKFDSVKWHTGANYYAFQSSFKVYNNDKFIIQLKPEKRIYWRNKKLTTEPGIDPALTRDVFISMGEPIKRKFMSALHEDQTRVNQQYINSVNAVMKNEPWQIHFRIIAMVRWIWLGSLIMLIGGLIALSDKRYRNKKRKSKETKDAEVVTE